ncbi:MAG: serine/threonine protein kinase [Myxococcales bacterium]|nr:serine/threonine protein kinase [Myxococcales bacterium]
MPPDSDKGDPGPDKTDKHDTDPAVADTQSSDGATPPEKPDASPGRPKRSVHVGDVLGRYELVSEVGEGGMATVYRARDRELRREVALKVLFPHLARRDEVVRRFHREARAAAGLEHPNILRVYDVGGGEADDPPYIVMELIRGRTLLAEIEQRGPMLSEVAACVGALLADALDAAHAAGIIHRDIKPANVLIDPGVRSESAPLHSGPKGRLLLADFGVARLETEDSLVTRTGSLLGTPAYMSPEQAGGDTATSQSDLYSLGATLYQLATGSLPYTGSAARVMTQIAQGALVSPVRKRAAVGPDLSRLIERLMAVEPAQRSPSAAAVATELREIATAGGFGEANDELADYLADPESFVRDKTPRIVTALVTSATQAIASAKLARAMALADRASALAPNDPAVTALIATVTEGGRSSRLRRMLAIGGLGGLGVLAAGGAVAGVLAMRGGDDLADARLATVMRDARSQDAALFASEPDAPVTSAGAGIVIDGGGRSRRADVAFSTASSLDAAIASVTTPPSLDAGMRPRHTDAALPMSPAIDAVMSPVAPAIAIDAAVAPAMGAIVVNNDTWCEVSIDGIDHGRRDDTPIRVPAGHHTVKCEQPNFKRVWVQDVDVAPNKTITVSGSLLAPVTVTLGIDVTIGGVPHRRGEVLKLPAGRIDVVAGGRTTYLTLRETCTIRGADDELDCYR